MRRKDGDAGEMETERERNKFVIPGAGVARIQVVALNEIKRLKNIERIR